MNKLKNSKHLALDWSVALGNWKTQKCGNGNRNGNGNGNRNILKDVENVSQSRGHTLAKSLR